MPELGKAAPIVAGAAVDNSPRNENKRVRAAIEALSLFRFFLHLERVGCRARTARSRLHTYPRYPTYPQVDSPFPESIRVASLVRGRKEADRKRTEVLPAIATADAAEILRGRCRGSDWQGDRRRSVRGNPIPISSKSSKTEAFGRKSREREPAEAAMLRLGTRNARRRALGPSGPDNPTRDSGGWWQHQPPLVFGAFCRSGRLRPSPGPTRTTDPSVRGGRTSGQLAD